MNKGFKVGIWYRWLSIFHCISSSTLARWPAPQSCFDWIPAIVPISFSLSPPYLQSISFALLSGQLPSNTSPTPSLSVQTHCGCSHSVYKLRAPCTVCSLFPEHLRVLLLCLWVGSSLHLHCPPPLHSWSSAPSAVQMMHSNWVAYKH